MPARRYRSFRISKEKKSKKIFSLTVIVSCVLIFSLILHFIFNNNFWDDRSQFLIVLRKPDNSVRVSVFDIKLEEIININVPSNTQVEVARSFGVWNLGSVWSLGEKEGSSGELLAATLRRHFKFPVSAWADSGAIGFSDTNFVSLLKATFSPYKSSLKFKDKLAIFFFAINVKNPNRIDIKLEETGYIKRTVLIDGEEGFVKSKIPPQTLMSIFADEEISKGEYSVSIKYYGDDLRAANEVGELIQVLGAKIVSITEADLGNGGCLILGNEDRIIKRIAGVLSCKIGESQGDSSFDIVVNLGEEFLKKF